MLVNLDALLRDARRDRYVVPAFDCTEDVLVRAILESAEACGSPVLLMCLGVDLAGNGMGYLPGLIRTVGAYHAISVVLHLGRRRELNQVSSVRLVLHGGSGTPDDQLRAAIELGICKVNIYVDRRRAMPGKTYYESLKVWATDPQRDPNRVEWVRFAADSPLADTPLASMPHISCGMEPSLSTWSCDSC